MAYHRERKVDTRIVRIFNTYGPRMDPYDGPGRDQLHPPGAERRADHGLRRGQADASLCYVSDLVRGINLTMESDFIEPINLGNPEEMTILQIAREVLDLIPASRSKVVHQPMPPTTRASAARTSPARSRSSAGPR
jgi:nucleoside-diphosphate-sugar epimerase